MICLNLTSPPLDRANLKQTIFQRALNDLLSRYFTGRYKKHLPDDGFEPPTIRLQGGRSAN